MTKDEVAAFIHRHDLAVISTLGKEYPESAVVEFADENFVLIFDTHDTSRKHKNILASPNVSLVIGWDENKTVQYEGEAALLEGDELMHYKQIYFEKNPEAQKWGNAPEMAYFKVTPKWVRLTDLNTKPWTISEFNF